MIRSLSVGIILSAQAVLCPRFFAQSSSPFTYDDLLLLDRISGLSVDPGGNYALYTVRSTDMEKNRGVSALWRKDLKNPSSPSARLPVSDDGAYSAQWGPDGNSILFLSARGGDGVQLWRADANGQNAVQLTRLPLDINAFRITPDGKGAVVSLAVFPDRASGEIEATVKMLAARKADPSSGELYTKLFIRHWDTWADGTRNHLFFVPIDGSRSSPVPLMAGFDGDVPSKPFGDEGDFVISPDGATVYFSARVAGTTEPWSTNFDLFSVPVAGGVPTDLTVSDPAWDAAPRVSPNGRTLAYKAMSRPGFEADRFVVHLRDLTSGTVQAIATDWDRSVDGMDWSRDGKSLLVTATDMGSQRLFRIDVRTGKVTPLSGNGHMDAYVELPKGFIFLKSAMDSPSQLYASKPGSRMIDQGAVKLTSVNSTLENKAFGVYEQFTFKGWNDEDVHGFVVKPANYAVGKKYPVAFLIHGGPQGSFGDSWSYRWNPQTYAGAGYAVVMIDFHGSTGYGQAFTDAISQHWGDRPLEDLRKGWQYALNTYPFLDGERAAALGASYGGFMVNWIAGNWKAPWKCLVSHDGIFDTRAMGYGTEELWFTDWENGASVFTDPAAYDAFNPMMHAKDWTVPMLVIHSDLDHRIPLEQGVGVFTALQARGVPSEFLRFPDENHWVLKPQNSLKWHRTVFGWLDQYIGRGMNMNDR